MKENGLSQGHKVLSALFAVLLFFFILSFSIGLPIYFRPFYYWQIEPLGLPELSGYSKAEIVEAYDDVLDYLTLPCTEFKSGVMPFSAEGADHFRDCKTLFQLNASAFVASGVGIAILIAIRRAKKLKPYCVKGVPTYAFSGVAAIVIPSVVGILAAFDFDRAFFAFHKIFFPNKLNWVMDPKTDSFVTVVPHEFFMSCAILIGACLAIISVTLIAVGTVKFFKSRNRGVDRTDK